MTEEMTYQKSDIMIEYKYNNQMLMLAKKNHLSFENHYNAIRLPKILIDVLQSGIQEMEEKGNVYYMLNKTSFLNQLGEETNKFEFFYDDLTGNEFSNNKVIFKIVKFDKITLKRAISFCHKLSNILPHSHNFCIIMSVDENYVNISFHMERKGETWLGDDLEVYKSDAILVMNVKNESNSK